MTKLIANVRVSDFSIEYIYQLSNEKNICFLRMQDHGDTNCFLTLCYFQKIIPQVLWKCFFYL